MWQDSAERVPEDEEAAAGSLALRESQGRYHTLFDLAPVAVYSCDAAGVILEYNMRAAQLWGRRPKAGDTDERFCGSFEMYRADGSYMPHNECPMGDVLSGKVPAVSDGEVHILRPDGSWAIVIVNIAALKNERDEIVGAINCFYDITHRKQAEEHLRLLKEQLEERVAERTTELTESQGRLRALAAELNVTEQRERKRLAADLHDYLGQLLALSKIRLSHASHLPMDPGLAKIIADLQSTTEKALNYTRTLISQLTPPDLADSSLAIALQWLATQMKERFLSVSLLIKSEIPALSEEQALLLFQSVRELLINCVKHANTREATVTLCHAEGSLSIQVSDTGSGFDAEAPGTAGSGRSFGLFSIRERMLALGGRFELLTSPGAGTTATLLLPLPPSTLAANPEL